MIDEPSSEPMHQGHRGTPRPKHEKATDSIRQRRQPGALRGRIHMAPDFDVLSP